MTSTVEERERVRSIVEDMHQRLRAQYEAEREKHRPTTLHTVDELRASLRRLMAYSGLQYIEPPEAEKK
jgi:hypothetical protein